MTMMKISISMRICVRMKRVKQYRDADGEDDNVDVCGDAEWYEILGA